MGRVQLHVGKLLHFGKLGARTFVVLLTLLQGVSIASGTDPDLAVTISHAGNFGQGQTGATYTIGVSNIGGSSSDGSASVMLSVPAGLTLTNLAGAGWLCFFGPATCTRLSNDPLAANASYPDITLTVSVGTTASSITTSVSCTSAGDLNSANDTASDFTVIAPPDLSASMSHTGNFGQGQVGASYTLGITNLGLGNSDGSASVIVSLPAGVVLTNLQGSGWLCFFGPATCTRLSGDALAGGASYPPITLTVTMNTNAASVTPSVSITSNGDVNAANNTASDFTQLDPPDLAVSMTHVGDFGRGQSGATYNIGVTNAGNGTSDGGASVVIAIPAGLTLTSLAGTGWLCSFGAATCTRLSGDTLAGQASYPAITLTVTVTTLAASVTPSVTVTSAGDLNGANNTTSDPTNIVLPPDLAVTIAHTGNFYRGQVGANYAIGVANIGSATSNGSASVVLSIPAGLAVTALQGTGWLCSIISTTCTRQASDPLVVLAAYPVITLTVTVSTTLPSLTPSVTVTSTGDVNAANNTANDPTIIDPPDVAVNIAHTGNFAQGQIGATYTINITNVGAATDGTVSMSALLPPGLTLTNLQGSGWLCSFGSATCTRIAGDGLAAGGGYPILSLTVNVSATAASVTTSATITGGNDANAANNLASDITLIDPPDLAVTMSHSGRFAQGQVAAIYTIGVHNAGNGISNGSASVVLTIPAGLTLSNLQGTGWLCSFGAATCTRIANDPLVAGANYPPLSLTVTVSTTAASIAPSVTVSSSGDLNAANNTASDLTLIDPPDLAVTMSHTGLFAQGQAGATYSIGVNNVGSGVSNGSVSVVIAIPAGLTLTNLQGTGWLCSFGSATCTRIAADALGGGASYPAITLTVSVNTGAGSLTPSVAITSIGDINAANNTASDPTLIDLPDLAVTMTHAGTPSRTQSGVTFTITVRNVGNGAADGTVIVTDTLPSGMTLTNLQGTGWLCAFGPASCTRIAGDGLAGSASYPSITLTVNLNASGPSIVNSVSIAGGADSSGTNNNATDSIAFLPDAPTISSAVPGDRQAVVAFVPPVNNGGLVTSYTVTCNPGGIGASGAASPITVTGLSNGTAYLCAVVANSANGSGPASGTLPVMPFGLAAAGSRKNHSGTDRDIAIDSSVAITGNVSVEPRAIGAGHQIVFQFGVAVTQAGTATVVDSGNAAIIGATANAAVNPGNNNEVIVTLTGLSDNRRVAVKLSGVNGAASLFSVPLGLLIGDTNNSRAVNAADVTAAKSRAGQAVDATNARFDVNTSGVISAADISAVKARAALATTLAP